MAERCASRRCKAGTGIRVREISAVFEHALEENPALSAVRLSFCLSGWADLARNYPPAQLKLEQHCEQSLQQFMATGLASDFHDYLSICRCLEKSDAALDTFCRIHETHPALAASVHDLIWEQLVRSRKMDHLRQLSGRLSEKV
jgi:hypothetical protein